MTPTLNLHDPRYQWDGVKLKKFLKRNELRQNVLADLLACSEGAVSLYIHERRRIPHFAVFFLTQWEAQEKQKKLEQKDEAVAA